MVPRPLIPARQASRGLIVARCAVLILAAVAYGAALHGPLVFDDATAITHNTTIATLDPAVALHPPAESPVAGRPVANYSLALNYAVGRLDPAGYHFANILVHLAAGLLLFGIVRRTLRGGQLGEDWAARSDPFALAVAAIWLLHPIQTEAVDYLAQRTELLVSFFLLATLYASIRAWSATGAVRIAWYGAGIVACLLGMGSKEVMIGAPVLVLLYDRAFRAASWRSLWTAAPPGRRLFFGGLAATWILLVALALDGGRRGSAGFGLGLTWYEYLNSQGWAVPHYLRLAFVPIHLTFDYGYRALPLWRGAPGLLLLGALAAITLWAWARAPRWAWLGFCGAWFFIILAPSSSVLPIATEIAAEHRFYLALAAVIVVAGVVIVAVWRRVAGDRFVRAGQAAAVCGVMLLAVLTWRRSALYTNPGLLWSDAIARRPDNARAWNNMGSVLADAPQSRNAPADSAFRVAVTLDSTYTPALYNLATADLRAGDPVEAEQLLQSVVARDSDDADALIKLATLLLGRGDAAGAEGELLRALQVAPQDVDARTLLGITEARLGKLNEARALLQGVLRDDPANSSARTTLQQLDRP